MKDRVSTKILGNGATRYGVYDETGKLLRYEYIKLEDEPDEEGDFFNKANMLPDSIPAALGLKMENPQVKDALNVLANIGNLHVWENKQVTDVPARITENAVSNLEVFYASANNVNPTDIGYYITYYVADSITVLDSGQIILSDPTEVTCYISNSTYSEYYNADALKGKYIRVKKLGSSYVHNRVLRSGIFKIDQNAVFYVSNPEGYTGIVTVDKAYSCVGIPFSKDSTITYLTSTDRNAYTEGTVDSTTIAYLGQIGNRARIEVGSYVGTGTYGSLNPSTSTFVGIPKRVIVECEQRSVNDYSNELGVFFYGQKIAQVRWHLNGSGYSNVSVVLSWNQNAVSWYGNDSSAHLNDENTTYHYIAIG